MVGRVNPGRRRCSNTGLPWGAPESNPSPKGRAGGAEGRNSLDKQRPTVTRFYLDVAGPKRRRDRRSRGIVNGRATSGEPPGAGRPIPSSTLLPQITLKARRGASALRRHKYRSSAVAAPTQAPLMHLGTGNTRFHSLRAVTRTEPRRVFRRLISVSYAAMSSVSRAA